MSLPVALNLLSSAFIVASCVLIFLSNRNIRKATQINKEWSAMNKEWSDRLRAASVDTLPKGQDPVEGLGAEQG